jgi:hypothetical protein
VEITIKGQGQVVISLINRTGEILVQKTITISGSSTVGGKTNVPLIVEKIGGGEILVAPVLVQSDQEQEVTFDDCAPSSVTKRRCQEIGCTSSVIEEALKGQGKAH